MTEAVPRNQTPSMTLIHPGETLAEEFLAYGLTQHKLATLIHVPPRRINEIVHGKRRITPDTALRLSRLFGTSDEFWMNLQNSYDLARAKETLVDELDAIQPLQNGLSIDL